MLIFGIISILQIALVPGLIACLSIRLTGGGLKLLISSFCLSLTINHFVVLLLTTLNLYTRNSVLTLFVLEFCVLLYLLVARQGFIAEAFYHDRKRVISACTDIIDSSLVIGLRKLAIAMIAIMLLVYLLYLIISKAGEIFSTWDAVVSWNRWAVDWANNQFPKLTWHYPQLLPTNFSLSYVFINDTSIQFFARFMMPLFPMMLLLMFLDLWLKSKHEGFILGAFLTILILVLFNTVNLITDGLADTPVACMGFAGFYLLLENKYQNDNCNRRNNIFISSLIIAGAALTKQAALFLVVLYPLFVILEKDVSGYQEGKLGRQLFYVLTLPFLLPLPWYIYVELNIWLGLNQSEIYLVDSVHLNRDALQRVEHSISILFTSVHNSPFVYNIIHKISLGFAEGKMPGVLLYTAILLGVLKCLDSKPYRKYVYGIVMPFTLIWIFFFSYDLRNFSLAVPFLAMTSAMGLYNDTKQDKRNVMLVLGCCIIILIAANGYFNENRLREMQFIKQKGLGDPVVNNIIYNLNDKMLKDQVILSNYQLLKYLPGLADKFKLLRPKVEIDNPNVRYILLMTAYDRNNARLNELQKMMSANKVRQLQDGGYFKLYEIVNQ